MRVVLDTNVVVSAFLTPSGVPAEVLRRALGGEPVPLYDERILAEYREVLERPRFKLDTEDVTAVLELLAAKGERVTAAPLVLVKLPDPDDLPFIEVAVAGQADALVTGNPRHFPDTGGVELLSPRQLLERLEDADR